MTRTIRRRETLGLFALAASTTTLSLPAAAHGGGGGARRSSVFTSTNAPAGNELLVFSAAEAGPATLAARLATQGRGTGAGLGSQGAVTLSGNGRHLFVVNAASNTVSTFSAGAQGWALTSVTDSGGLTPTSVAEHRGLVYVLNAGGSGNLAGFRLRRGELVPLADGLRPMSAAGGTAPAQVGFDDEGSVLVVTERATGLLVSHDLRDDGSLGRRSLTPSAGATPFGFAFTRRDVLVVSEAQGGAPLGSTVSSYRFDERQPSAPLAASRAVPTTQTAACWVAVSPDGRHAYAANAGSDSVSLFRVGRDGRLTLLEAVAGSSSAGGGALDLAVTPDGEQLHLLAPRSHQVVSFAIGDGGRLQALGAVGGLPAGSAGLAAG